MARKQIEQTKTAVDMDPEDVVHGYYVGVRSLVIDQRSQSLYGFWLIDAFDAGGTVFPPGKVVEIWGSVLLDDMMGKADPWAETWVTFQGTKGRTKIYKLEQDPEKVLPESDRQPF